MLTNAEETYIAKIASAIADVARAAAADETAVSEIYGPSVYDAEQALYDLLCEFFAFCKNHTGVR